MRHFLSACINAAIVAVVFGIIGKETVRGRMVYGIKVFAEFVGIVLLLGWILYYLPI